MTVLKDNNNIFASNIEKYAGNESTLQYKNVTLNFAKKKRDENMVQVVYMIGSSK